MTDMWVEKYRPKTLDEYVWRDPDMKTRIEDYLNSGTMPHMLFVGTQGIGKTSLAKLVLKILDIPQGDILWVNASRERRIDQVQDKIGNFVNTWAMGPSGMKYLILDEFDAISPMAQKMLRADMETYSENCRVIATANYINKIIPAIRSRFQEFIMKEINEVEFTVRLANILLEENIKFELEILDQYIKASYPDLRKCINMLQQNVINNELSPLGNNEDNSDYMLNVIDLFKKKQFSKARKLIVEQVQPEEYEDMFRFLYKNIELFGKDEASQDQALLIIRQGLVNHTLCADAEINLSATIVELQLNMEG